MSTVEEAICFAVKAHEGQKRKFSDIPYILHPMEVASIIAGITTDREVIAAGLLHDVIEDTPVTMEMLEERFSPRICALVRSETEDKQRDRPPSESWYDRKKQSLVELENAKDQGVKILWLGDKLSNIRSFYRAYEKDGAEIWKKTHESDPTAQEWYYRTIAEDVSELSDTAAYKEYVELLNRIFGREL